MSAVTAPVALRDATPDDLALILQLIRELAIYERLQHMVVAEEARLHDALFGARKYAEVVIAEFQGAPAGFALFFHNFSTFLGRPGLYLEDLFVRPAFRGRGIGKTLLIHLARTAHDRGCGRFEWSVLGWNASAIAFYRSLGAQPMDEWKLMRVTGPALEAMARSGERA